MVGSIERLNVASSEHSGNVGNTHEGVVDLMYVNEFLFIALEKHQSVCLLMGSD